MPAYLPGTDAVHGDFHPTNFLVADSRITGVVDWTGVGSGDRHFDLVTLRFSLHGRRMDGQVVAALDEYLEQAPPDTVRAAWAHMSLRMVDWATRFYSPEDVENWLDLVETRSG
jgi:aminoglycoside phosphotransferase (APT) family kinase protein